MSGQGLDYATRRRIREFIRLNMAAPLTAKQIAVHFRLRPDDEPDIRDLMIETALLGVSQREPEVLTPPAEVLDQMLAAVAGQSLADYRTGTCLRTCQSCRNHLLYLLDTAPYTDCPEAQITARLQALHIVHEAHGAEGPDRDAPHIRWITP